MKKKVTISTYAMVMTIISLAILIGIMCAQVSRENLTMAYIIAAGLVILCTAGLYYSPMMISVDDTNLNIHRSLRIKPIPLKDITSIQMCAPTMGARRIFGSGGWFGYYGWFSERDLGKYFAYYGKSSDCFLVRLKDGRQYMLGCNDAQEVVKYIEARIS